MTKRYPLLSSLAVFVLAAISCVIKDDQDIWLNKSPDVLELFAPGLISTSMYERDIAIHPDGDQIIYTLSSYDQKKRVLIHLTKRNHRWSEPEVISFSGVYQDIEPFFSPDGSKLFFSSNRPMDEDSTRHDYNIWSATWKAGQWAQPHPLDTLINSKGDEFFPSVAANGNLYFTATKESGIGREDIWRSVWTGRAFDEPEVLDSSINTGAFEFNAYIDPNEELLVFSSYGRPDGLGGGDLYYAKKNQHGIWNPAVHIEAPINSSGLDYCPFIDWKNQNFYFTSNRQGAAEEVMNYKNMIDYNSGPENGMGDIYRIKLKNVIK